ncbi:sodium channel, voltage-gated, type I, beta a isoform X2 [Centropristis striata]|uniref:sodium channel, voltage-gated, type I, beta a isoform X2 n=1 Tax=Centropristis striata TaxID=184440 RepID=UPI0027DFE94B|nr:sodium channel, voltage-gated, type I, beta a isoform X2 [Centropristis striata]
MPLRAATSLIPSVRMSAIQELLLLLPLALLALQASLCRGACVEVDSETEAVDGDEFKLGCISCKSRGEVQAVASVVWRFKADGKEWSNFYKYEDKMGIIFDPRFSNRLTWSGSKNTTDLQDGSILILNVTLNDTGTYECIFNRTLKYENNYQHFTSATKTIKMRVVSQVTRGMASILSEVMMYVSIIGLQVWLVVEMIYCYRKIAAAGEEALRESASRKNSRRLV